MYLVDTNIWLELLLDQEKAQDVRSFFQVTGGDRINISEFSLYSMGVILTQLKKDDLFKDFISDTLEEAGIRRIRLENQDLAKLLEVRKEFNLTFDDSYQYVAAQKHGLTIVSFDSDFDRTKLGRKTPAEL